MPALSKSDRALRRLARLRGIQTAYRDGTGTKRVVASDALRVLLTGMYVACSTDQDVIREIVAARNRPWTLLVDPVYVVWKNRSPGAWWVNLPIPEHSVQDVILSWKIVDEAGKQQCFELSGKACSIIGKQTVERAPYVRVALPFPEDCELGYYRLRVMARGPALSLDGEAWMIVAPERCYVPERPIRAWGVTAQLYGLRSSHNWGIGDFRDLTALAGWVGPTLGADMIGLNPLHALTPMVVSPYSPSSRLFHNPLYLDIEGIEECRADRVQEKLRNPAFQERLQELRTRETVDYQAVRDLKGELLEVLYRVFVDDHVSQSTEHAEAFERYIHEEGRVLERFAVFQVLQELNKGNTWKQWPKPLQRPDSIEVAAFADRNRERVRFYQYVQWQCAIQLCSLSQTMKRKGMTLGLYHDLAIGIHPDGADAWMFQHELAEGVEVGAPPDAFNLSGQTWGLQPPLPEQLRQSGYEFIRDTFRHNMEHCGILRIDHALGMFRLYWVPTGCKGSEGAYVHYRTEELLAVLALESVRHQVVVVGEDLGTVTPAIRRRLAQAGLLSYRLLMFERTDDGGYRRPRQFPAQALVSVNTHDLPTLRGFWAGRDIDVKEEIGLYPSGDRAEQDRLSRTHDRRAFLEALEKEGLLPADLSVPAEELRSLPDELCRAIYSYLARTASWVVATSLEDLLGEVETPNVPGAPEGTYPVWRRKLRRSLEEIQHDRNLLDFAAAVHRERQRSLSRASH